MDIDELVTQVRDRLPGLLLASDFDGTLAPIVADPERSRPVEGAIEALTAVARRGARVAVVTGRDATTVLRLSGLERVPGLVVEALYGLERWAGGELTTPDEPASVTRLRESLPRWLAEQAADPAVWVEDKRLSLVLHTRRASDPAAEQERLREPAHALGEQLGLEVHDGRHVLEFRVCGYDKGAAIRRLAEGAGAVLYAGDDLGDLPAFEATRELGGWSVFAASAEREAPEGVADVIVDGPEGVVDLLRRITAGA